MLAITELCHTSYLRLDTLTVVVTVRLACRPTCTVCTSVVRHTTALRVLCNFAYRVRALSEPVRVMSHPTTSTPQLRRVITPPP